MASFSVVVPCFDEEHNIKPLYDRVCQQLAEIGEFEIIFIDDGSRDQTLPIIKQLAADDSRVKYISFSQNFGLEAAFRAGFKYAAKQWIIQIDADLQSPPEEIPKLIDKARQGYDIVFALRKNRQDSLLKRWGSKSQHFIATHIFKIKMPHGASTFRIIDSRVAKKIIHKQTAQPYFLPECLAVGARYTFVEVEHHPRTAGKSKFNFIKSIQATKDLLIGHSLMPLNFFLFVALIASTSSIILPLNILLVISLTLFSFGLWINASYIARLVSEVTSQKLYFTREANIPIDPADDLYEFDYSSPIEAFERQTL